MNIRSHALCSLIVSAAALAGASCTHTQGTSKTATVAPQRATTSAEKELTDQERALKTAQAEDTAREQELRKAVDLNPNRRAGYRP